MKLFFSFNSWGWKKNGILWQLSRAFGNFVLLYSVLFWSCLLYFNVNPHYLFLSHLASSLEWIKQSHVIIFLIRSLRIHIVEQNTRSGTWLCLPIIYTYSPFALISSDSLPFLCSSISMCSNEAVSISHVGQPLHTLGYFWINWCISLKWLYEKVEKLHLSLCICASIRPSIQSQISIHLNEHDKMTAVFSTLLSRSAFIVSQHFIKLL